MAAAASQALVAQTSRRRLGRAHSRQQQPFNFQPWAINGKPTEKTGINEQGNKNGGLACVSSLGGRHIRSGTTIMVKRKSFDLGLYHSEVPVKPC